MRVVWVSAALVALAFAGCVGDSAESNDDGLQGTVDRDSFQLQSGKGAIAGLLVDDRFRPIHLTDNPQSEFQTTGFVLVQETGQEARTNENGEFSFVNLEPSQYTLRVTAAGHEATPQRVTVTDGVFNEASIVARRTASDNSFILTQEYAVFIGCSIDALVISYANPSCLGDLSGDSGRFDFFTDLRPYMNETTAVVTEALFNRPGYNDVIIRYFGCSLPEADPVLGACSFAEAMTEMSDYLRIVKIPGEIQTEHDEGKRNVPFRMDVNFQTAIFPHPDNHGTFYPLNEPLAPVVDPTGRSIRGVGTQPGVKAQFLQSVFLGEPEVDLETYCVLC